MKISKLGRTGIQVSEFCLGLLPMGPRQLNISEEEAAGIVNHAFESGVTFFDTAEVYRTQSYLAKGLGKHTNDAVIATKSGAQDEDTMAADVELALKELNRDYIDVFHLHAAREADPFNNRAGALKRLLRFKDEGIIRAVGVATHFISVTREAARRDDIDALIAINNVTGMGIIDGSPEEMSAAMKEAADAGVGVYVMKPLAGGNLIDRMMEAMDYARSIEGSAAVALGVVSMDELDFALKLFENRPLSREDYEKTAKTLKRYIVLTGGCKGCGTCVETCPTGAIELVEGKAHINEEECIKCGYCGAACPEFWIRAV